MRDDYLRVLTVELSRLSEDRDEHRRLYNELRGLMDQIQQVQNYFYDTWRRWHFANGTEAKLLEFHAAWKKWKESKGGKESRPKCDAVPMPSELAKEIYHGAVARWPDLHVRLVTLTLNRLAGVVTSGKSAHGNWPQWHSRLLYREQIPSFTHPCPLAFDKANSYLEPPKPGAKDSFRLHVSFSRVAVEGRTRKSSVTYHGVIWDRGRRMVGRKRTLAKVASGEYSFAGSQVFLRDGRLFAAIAYRQPKPAMQGGDVLAVVRASEVRPLTLRAGGRSQWIGGDGRLVKAVRRQVVGQRWSRQESYRRAASSARKGHGRRRAMEKVTLLSNRWRDFRRTFNRNLASEVCRKALLAGCGGVLYVRTDGDSRFLALAGRYDPRDSTRWDWYGLEKAIAEQCEEMGLTFVLRQSNRVLKQSRKEVASGVVSAVGK